MKEKDKTDFKPIKHLPRDPNGNISFEPFEANGHKYFFIRPDDPKGIEKWTEYEKLKIVVGTGRTFENIVRGYQELQNLLGSDKPLADIRTEAILLVDSYKRAVLDMSKERYDKALYLCTIFIYRDGDDPYKWDMNRAEQYIGDWKEERLSEQDFFLHSLISIHGFNSTLQKLSEEAKKQAERLSVVTGSKRMEPTTFWPTRWTKTFGTASNLSCGFARFTPETTFCELITVPSLLCWMNVRLNSETR